ncbi:CD225/dispanin family protein [Rhodococcus sp. ARC_M6]|uniref:CD225/dispanin family protein n=1 Tax=Rhodococcus sp. ARC_M6 TaxID=2928852 RepID=UPI001FB400BB|nr:CD225/dispanin family protein [Rhodococcus sp. ARC_M6]MCJ0901962.1 CD225/dispanin family protein [Rhodococcus sp. ARC_M6]
MTSSEQPIQPAIPRNPERPPVNAGWAVASLLFFWPLAFAAFTHAFNVYPLWADGDVAGSRYASDRVKRLGQISLIIAGALLLLVCILYAIAAIVWVANGDDSMMYHRRYMG